MEKICIFVIAMIAAVLAAVPPNQFDLPPAMHSHVKEVGEAAKNVGTRTRSFASGGERCMLPCIQNFGTSIQRELGDMQPRPGEYNVQAINTLCAIYDTYATCMNGCDGGTTKDTVMRMTSMFHTLCKTSIKDNLECLNTVQRATKTSCDSQCRPYDNTMNRYKSNPPRTLAALTDMAKAACMLTKCRGDCSKTEVASQCGQQVQTDIETLVQSGLDTMRAAMEARGVESAIPDECRA